jgi:hypothetical protein
MKYKTVNYTEFQIKRRYGIELETGGEVSKEAIHSYIGNRFQQNSLISKYEMSEDPKRWHIKDDSSSGPAGKKGPKGVEIASFIGNDLKDLLHMAEVARSLSKLGCKINDNCGFHIHAEAVDISHQQMAIILAHWLKIENVLSMALPERRRDNFYCKPILSRCKAGEIIKEYADSYWSANQIWYLLKPKNLGIFNNDDRKVSLNIVNYTRCKTYDSEKRNTIELRWPEGTLDKDDVLNWVVLFLNFIDVCSMRQMPANLLSADLMETLKILGLHHDNHKFTIFDCYLHKARIWFLNRIIKHSCLKRIKNKAINILETMEGQK